MPHKIFKYMETTILRAIPDHVAIIVVTQTMTTLKLHRKF